MELVHDGRATESDFAPVLLGANDHDKSSCSSWHRPRRAMASKFYWPELMTG